MSVYTPVQTHELKAFLAGYDVGDLVDFVGISAGIENTNYFVETTREKLVLTLFEELGEDELPYFLDLMAFLADHGVPCPHPMADRGGQYLQHLKGKPAALVKRLTGKDVAHPTPTQCEALGRELGRMHTVGREFNGLRENPRGRKWWRQTMTALEPHLSDADRALLREEVRHQDTYRYEDLPRGVIHADLFRDNVLFEDEQLTGIIDFYYACNDVLLYDVAVTVNDWCSDGEGRLDDERTLAFLNAYRAVRPTQALEQGAWPLMLRAAALRFWVSRLYDLHFPKEGELTHIKDPEVFKRILVDRIDREAEIRSLWAQ